LIFDAEEEEICPPLSPSPSSFYSDSDSTSKIVQAQDYKQRIYTLKSNAIWKEIHLLNGEKQRILDVLHTEKWTIKEAKRLEDEAFLQAEKWRRIPGSDAEAAWKYWEDLQLRAFEAYAQERRSKQRLGKVNMDTLYWKRKLQALEDWMSG